MAKIWTVDVKTPMGLHSGELGHLGKVGKDSERGDIMQKGKE